MPSYYGAEVVNHAHASENLTLSGTTIQQDANAGWAMTATNVRGSNASFRSGENMTMTNCKVRSANANWKATFTSCPQVGYARSGENLTGTTSSFGTVNANWKLVLDHCTVTGDASAGEDLHATKSTIDKVNANWKLVMTASQCKEARSGEGTTLNNTSVTRSVHANYCLNASNCRELGDLDAGESMELRSCPQVKSAKAKNLLLLENTNVQGNAEGSTSQISQSTVTGTLSISDQETTIKESKIGSIKVGKPSDSSGLHISIGGGTISIGAGITINGVPLQINPARSRDRKQETQVLTLDNSTVEGRIEFSTRDGRVVLLNGSKVDLSQVSGAEVVDEAGVVLLENGSVQATAKKTEQVVTAAVTTLAAVEKRNCIVCDRNEINAIAIPCGHKLYCMKCLPDLSQCNRCSQAITQAIEVLTL